VLKKVKWNDFYAKQSKRQFNLYIEGV